MSTSTSLSVPNNACNNQNLTLFDLSAFKLVETVHIDNGNYIHTTAFVIDGLLTLRNVTILSNSFTQHPNGYDNDPNKSFHILNCDKLESISIGEYSFSDYGGEFELSNLPQLQSFSDYGGEFELSNLPQLQSIQIGQLNSNSYNFYSALFEIESIELIFDLLYRFTFINNIINRRWIIWKFDYIPIIKFEFITIIEYR